MRCIAIVRLMRWRLRDAVLIADIERRFSSCLLFLEKKMDKSNAMNYVLSILAITASIPSIGIPGTVIVGISELFRHTVVEKLELSSDINKKVDSQLRIAFDAAKKATCENLTSENIETLTYLVNDKTYRESLSVGQAVERASRLLAECPTPDDIKTVAELFNKKLETEMLKHNELSRVLSREKLLTLSDLLNIHEDELKSIIHKQNEMISEIAKLDFRITNLEGRYIGFVNVANESLLKDDDIAHYCRYVKKHFFTYRNVSPYERFFLLDCDANITLSELKSTAIKISRNWSKLSPREEKPFCPYVYLHNISEEKLIDIKKALYADGIKISDGYAFKGADFSPELISERADSKNNIQLKIINELAHLDDILAVLKVTKEIYQFFLSDPFYLNDDSTHVIMKIQIQETKNIELMV